MIIKARVDGNHICPLEPIPFKNGDIITIKIESGLYSLIQEIGPIVASEDIDIVLKEMRHKQYDR